MTPPEIPPGEYVLISEPPEPPRWLIKMITDMRLRHEQEMKPLMDELYRWHACHPTPRLMLVRKA